MESEGFFYILADTDCRCSCRCLQIRELDESVDRVSHRVYGRDGFFDNLSIYLFAISEYLEIA
jgi:hypothetical protein